MEFTFRAATGKPNYPLPIDQPIQWQSGTTSISLGDVPQGHIIVPSFSQVVGTKQPISAYTFSINADDQHSVYLQRVPAEGKQHCARGGSEQSISTHIDCFHTHTDLSNVSLTLDLEGISPEEALLTLSIRPIAIETPKPEVNPLTVPQPKPISQMSGPANIRQRICSPTALTMCLSTYEQTEASSLKWLEIVDRCHDPVSQAYGSWPLAIRAANELGIHGAVETFTDWQDAREALTGGHPIVCSINFDKGGLTGAPLSHTSGHLVVLYGIEGRQVLVMDPAAAEHADVPIQYDIEEFSKAWLHQRGAAYIFSNYAHTLSH